MIARTRTDLMARLALLAGFILMASVASGQPPPLGPPDPKAAVPKAVKGPPAARVRGMRAAAGNSITLPLDVKAQKGMPVEVKATTEGKTVRWLVMDEGLALIPPHLLKDSKTALVWAMEEGVYRLAAYTVLDGEPTEAAICLVTVGKPAPKPPVPPKPDPDKEKKDKDPLTPPIPIKDVPFAGVEPAGLRVLIIEESAERPKLPSSQRLVILSRTVREYLDAKTANGKGPGGMPWAEWRIYDKDQDVSQDSEHFKRAMGMDRKDKDGQPGKLPWLLIGTGKDGYSGPLPMTVKETMDLLRKYGG